MKIDSKDFRVKPGERVRLKKRPTLVDPFYTSQKHYRKLLSEHIEQLSSLQQMHYASNRYALLLIFQAMDAAGKDGIIRHIMSGVNPQGCRVDTVQASHGGRTRPRLSLADDTMSSGTRHDRCLQPLLL